MKKLLTFLKPYRKEAVTAPAFKLLEAFFDLLVPMVIKAMIDTGIGQNDKVFLWKSFGLLILLALIGIVCALSAQFFAAKAAVGFATDLRSALFAKIQSFSFTQTDKLGTSSLITRMTADVNQIQSGINLFLRLLLRSPIIVFGAMILAFTLDVRAALIFAVLIPILFAVVTAILIAGIPLYQKVQEKLDRVTLITRENLTGVRVIRAFCKEEDEIKRFEDANGEQRHWQNKVGRLTSLMNPLTMIPVNLGIAALLWTGAIRVDAGNLSTGAVVALINYMSQILVELMKFTNTVFTVNKSLACAARIERVMEMPLDSLGTPATDATFDATGTAISFSNVSLTYAGNSASSLSELNFSILPGMTLGIIGSTGSGKTSVANLIAGFYPATAGTVSLFGKDVKSMSEKELHKSVATVAQKAVLFRGDLRSNLLFGNPSSTDEELWEALQVAQADGFVREKEGLDTKVEQAGKNFSGGQRQRLTIARALVGKAPILIFDDSSSALDFATDAALRSALSRLDFAPTKVFISQRTSSIRHADRILVLEEGKQVGFGTHEELLQSCPIYREIHSSQDAKGGKEA